MCPVMITAPYDTFEDAIKLAQSDLEYEGKGHTASIHSNDMEHVRYAGENLTVSRLIVNQSSSTGAGGSLYNGFAPTTTLGCGSWGNNSISENLNYTHLINVSQIGLYNKDKKFRQMKKFGLKYVVIINSGLHNVVRNSPKRKDF